MGNTALSGVVGVGVWVTLITPKVNTCICVTHSKRVHTVTSAEVRRGKGEADPRHFTLYAININICTQRRSRAC